MRKLKPLLFLLSVRFFLYSKSLSVPDDPALLGDWAHTARSLLEENADLRQRIAQLERRAQECEVGNCFCRNPATTVVSVTAPCRCGSPAAGANRRP